MEYIPSATEIAMLRKYLADVKNKNPGGSLLPPDYSEPEILPVMKAYGLLFREQLTLKESGALYDDLDYNQLAGLSFGDLARYIIDHPGRIDRLIDEYEAKTKVIARDNIFRTKLGEMTGYQFRDYLIELGFNLKDLQSYSNS